MSKLQGLLDDGYSLKRVEDFNLTSAALSLKSVFGAPVKATLVLITFTGNLAGTGETLTIKKVNAKLGTSHIFGKITVPALSPSVNYIFEEDEGLLQKDDSIQVDLTNAGGATNPGMVEIAARRL